MIERAVRHGQAQMVHVPIECQAEHQALEADGPEGFFEKRVGQALISKE